MLMQVLWMGIEEELEELLSIDCVKSFTIEMILIYEYRYLFIQHYWFHLVAWYASKPANSFY
jgi:hypothetical protein